MEYITEHKLNSNTRKERTGIIANWYLMAGKMLRTISFSSDCTWTFAVLFTMRETTRYEKSRSRGNDFFRDINPCFGGKALLIDPLKRDFPSSGSFRISPWYGYLRRKPYLLLLIHAEPRTATSTTNPPPMKAPHPDFFSVGVSVEVGVSGVVGAGSSVFGSSAGAGSSVFGSSAGAGSSVFTGSSALGSSAGRSAVPGLP